MCLVIRQNKNQCYHNVYVLIGFTNSGKFISFLISATQAPIEMPLILKFYIITN